MHDGAGSHAPHVPLAASRDGVDRPELSFFSDMLHQKNAVRLG